MPPAHKWALKRHDWIRTGALGRGGRTGALGAALGGAAAAGLLAPPNEKGDFLAAGAGGAAGFLVP